MALVKEHKLIEKYWADLEEPRSPEEGETCIGDRQAWG